MKNNIVKAVGLVTIVTVIGKLLGFGRETVIAAFYGASAQSDVYFVAAVIPTLLFAAISMAITTGLVPIYIEERNKDKAEATKDDECFKYVPVRHFGCFYCTLYVVCSMAYEAVCSWLHRRSIRLSC